MILLKAELTIAAEGHAAFLQQMAVLAAASRAEDGCLSFACYEAVAAPNTFIVLQEWASRADLDRHEASAHVAAFKAQAAHLIVARLPTQVYEVSSVSGL
ncbi:MAG: antibiotic biosynthesis monooxygenase [Anaerolineae bacterium]|nr:antibiotic biosynthesis monooxygenase [Anaerolineae bacterium]